MSAAKPSAREEFFFSGGIAEFIRHLNRGKIGAA